MKSFPPDSPMAILVAKIEEFGWAIQHVGPGDRPEQKEFSYTVGLTALGHPEIVMIGMPFDSAHSYLNLAASLIRDEGQRFEHGTVTEELTGPGGPVMFIDVIDDSNLRAVAALYDTVSAVQLIYPDHNGKLPWMSGCANPPSAQPLLGVRPSV